MDASFVSEELMQLSAVSSLGRSGVFPISLVPDPAIAISHILHYGGDRKLEKGAACLKATEKPLPPFGVVGSPLVRLACSRRRSSCR